MILENITSFVKKNFSRKDILFIIGLLFLYLLTRLLNLEKFPIFNDEGIYIRWAKTAWHDASWRFISLTDGKQPLQTWATIPFLKLFPDNALFAGRLFAVTTGLTALAGIFSLLFYLFDKKTAYIGSLLYIFTPYFLFYDRMALSDSGVNAGFVWILFFSIVLAKTIKLDIALIFGAAAGLALLTKSSAQVFLLLAALSPILFTGKERFGWKKVSNYYFLYLIVAGIAFAIYNIQRLSPFLHFVAEKNKVFVMTFGDFLKHPTAVAFHNLYTLPLYVSWEMGFGLTLVGLLGYFLIYKKEKALFFYLCLWLIALYVGVSLFTIVLYPRYVIFFSTLLLITAACFLTRNGNKIVSYGLALCLAISFIVFDYPIIFDVKNIPFPPVDRGQYLEGWTAGWGMQEIMDFARDKSHEKPVILLAEGDFGMTGDVLNVLLKRDDRISIKGYWPLTENDLVGNQKELTNNYVFIVMSHDNKLPENWPMTLINRYEKPNHKSTIYLLELIK